MADNHLSTNGIDLRVVTEVPLRQFTWWLLMVLLVTLFGYPGVVCITPMAWRSKSGLRSQRLIESALAGGLLGLLQGMLFGIIVPFMGLIQDEEWTRSIILILLVLLVGMLAGAALAFFTAYLNENRRENT